MKRLPVTVVIPVRNEEGNIGRCLARLADFEDVVVVDSSSTDRTADIARETGARVVNFKWDGKYPKKRNWVLLNYEFATEWVLFLDADEFLDERFCDALEVAVREEAVSGYWLNYTNYFLGKPLRHGLPQRKLALFRRGKGFYERIEEDRWSSLDMEVHEHPIVDGRVGEISTKIHHDDDRGIRRFVERHVDYAYWEAERALLMRTQKAVPGAKFLTQRQKVKYKHLNAWWYPAVYFVYAYVVRLGMLDGWRGLAYATMKFWYFTLIKVRIQEISYRRPE